MSKLRLWLSAGWAGSTTRWQSAWPRSRCRRCQRRAGSWMSAVEPGICCAFWRSAARAPLRSPVSTRHRQLVQVAGRLSSDARIEVREGSAERLPYADAAFDLVVSTTSFDHWHDQAAGLAECARVVGNDGRLVLADLFSPFACAHPDRQPPREGTDPATGRAPTDRRRTAPDQLAQRVPTHCRVRRQPMIDILAGPSAHPRADPA
jgi:SAM-dependent methyltransferase